MQSACSLCSDKCLWVLQNLRVSINKKKFTESKSVHFMCAVKWAYKYNKPYKHNEGNSFSSCILQIPHIKRMTSWDKLEDNKQWNTTYDSHSVNSPLSHQAWDSSHYCRLKGGVGNASFSHFHVVFKERLLIFHWPRSRVSHAWLSNSAYILPSFTHARIRKLSHCINCPTFHICCCKFGLPGNVSPIVLSMAVNTYKQTRL